AAGAVTGVLSRAGATEDVADVGLDRHPFRDGSCFIGDGAVEMERRRELSAREGKAASGDGGSAQQGGLQEDPLQHPHRIPRATTAEWSVSNGAYTGTNDDWPTVNGRLPGREV